MHKFTYTLLEFFTEDSKLMQPNCNIKDKLTKVGSTELIGR